MLGWLGWLVGWVGGSGRGISQVRGTSGKGKWPPWVGSHCVGCKVDCIGSLCPKGGGVGVGGGCVWIGLGWTHVRWYDEWCGARFLVRGGIR